MHVEAVRAKLIMAQDVASILIPRVVFRGKTGFHTRMAKNYNTIIMIITYVYQLGTGYKLNNLVP